MVSLTCSTTIYKPIKQVFEYVSAPENDFEWQYGTLDATRLSSQAGAPDRTFFRSVGHLMGRRILGTYEVTEYEPDRKYAFKSISGPLQLHTSYIFEIADGGTRVKVSTQANVINFFQVNETVLGKGMKKQIQEDLAMLKNVLEERRTLPVRKESESARLNHGIPG